MCILGGDTVAGGASGVGASGLAGRRYGMFLVAGKTSPLRYLAARRILIWDGEKRRSPHR
jgi:hypothetical protein